MFSRFWRAITRNPSPFTAWKRYFSSQTQTFDRFVYDKYGPSHPHRGCVLRSRRSLVAFYKATASLPPLVLVRIFELQPVKLRSPPCVQFLVDSLRSNSVITGRAGSWLQERGMKCCPILWLHHYVRISYGLRLWVDRVREEFWMMCLEWIEVLLGWKF